MQQSISIRGEYRTCKDVFGFKYVVSGGCVRICKSGYVPNPLCNGEWKHQFVRAVAEENEEVSAFLAVCRKPQ